MSTCNSEMRLENLLRRDCRSRHLYLFHDYGRIFASTLETV
jgi:hypothetical protein